ncbi:MAG: hypothetical protein J6W75_11490 [Bacteroidaceae bacterium]|nr:hypothetical protein [Bacteroidaceae bacterium]
MKRFLFVIGLFILFYQIGLSASIDSLKWIEMPVKAYPDYPVQILETDSLRFIRQKNVYSSYESSAPIAKKNRTIKVKCANKTYKFKDSKIENEEEYFVEGSYKSWIIIKGYLYWNYEQFYMINPKTGEIDSLAGEPLFYEDKILCVEGDATDGTKMIEVWQMDKDKISLIYSTDLKRRNIFSVDDIYLLNDTVFLKSEERYLKIYYDGPRGNNNTHQGYQKFGYNGRSALGDASHLKKELDRMHGLFWYDYGARRYDPAIGLFTQVDPLCEDYPHLNPYLYCAGNPVRYVDLAGMRPRRIEALAMADDVYDPGKKDLPGDWTWIDPEDWGLTLPNSNGFKSAIYGRKNENGGFSEYVYATAGTDLTSLEDWKQDFKQLTGDSEQYRQSVETAVQIKSILGDQELTYLGHSLGGGLASANALKTGDPAITFNAAGLSAQTKQALQLNNKADITAYVVHNEFLNNSQALIGLRAEGRISYLPSVPLSIFPCVSRPAISAAYHTMTYLKLISTLLKDE